MGDWLYHWLPLVFGCHCRPDRSFFWKGRQFPLCARCTGELIGIWLGLLSFPFLHPAPLWTLLLLVPMVLDGGVQQLTAYESGNFRRLITGLLFGYGLAVLFLHSTLWCFAYGSALGERIKAGWG